LGAIRTAGGVTVAQSEDTCVVPGMPRAAISRGYASKIIPLDGLGQFLIGQYGVERNGSEKVDAQERSEKNEKSEKLERSPVSTPRA